LIDEALCALDEKAGKPESNDREIILYLSSMKSF